MDIHPMYHNLTMVLQPTVTGIVYLQFLGNGVTLSKFSNSRKIHTFPEFCQTATYGSYHTQTLPEFSLHHSDGSFWGKVGFPSQLDHTAQKMLHLDFPQAKLKFFGISVLILNSLPPNDIYICRTAPLTSRRCILNIYSTNIHTEYFKHAA
jgi:hypothetical protein